MAAGARREALRIVVVNHETPEPFALSSLLSERGHTVVACVSTAEAAVNAAMVHQPNLVVMDAGVLGTSGAMQAACVIWDRWEIPTVAVAGYPNPRDQGWEGHPVGLLVRPVTTELERSERQAAEAALRRSEERYRGLTRAIASIVWTTRSDGSVDDMPEWRELTGQSHEEVQGWGWLNAIHPEDRAHARAVVEHATSTASSYDMEYRLRQPDGTYRWYNSRGVPVLNEDGTPREFVGVCIDINDRKRAEERQALLVHELNHRVKNTLAVVQSVAARTLKAAPSLEAFRRDFEARLAALSSTHDILTRNNWESASLHELLKAELAPYQSDDVPKLVLNGPDARVAPRAALALGMMIHELATNAVKYGALSVATGRIEVSSGTEVDSDGQEALRLEWQERGGPPVKPPARRGFGSLLVERSISHELHGRAEVCFEPAGLRYSIVIPASENLIYIVRPATGRSRLSR
ncbi:MAG: PAS domain-containing protein [Actinomycetota bacterium]|nr:PAS domain-containing protein [Actinomycetota bacterium]